MRPLEECLGISLCRQSNGYFAIYHMNESEERVLKKAPYKWRFDQFCEPNKKLERIIEKQGMLPRVICSQRRCIDPPTFLK